MRDPQALEPVLSPGALYAPMPGDKPLAAVNEADLRQWWAEADWHPGTVLIRIRPAAGAEAVFVLGEDCRWTPKYTPAIPYASFIVSDPWVCPHEARHAEDAILLFDGAEVRSDGTLLAIAVASDVVVGALALLEDDSPDLGQAWAVVVAVHPDHRRRGVATALMDAAGSWAAQNGALIRVTPATDDGRQWWDGYQQQADGRPAYAYLDRTPLGEPELVELPDACAMSARALGLEPVTLHQVAPGLPWEGALEEIDGGPLYCRLCEAQGHACVASVEDHTGGDAFRLFVINRGGPIYARRGGDATDDEGHGPVCAGCGCTTAHGCAVGCYWSPRQRSIVWSGEAPVREGGPRASIGLPLCSVCDPPEYRTVDLAVVTLAEYPPERP